MGSNPSKTPSTVHEISMKSLYPVYVPLESLTEPTVRSIISVVTTFSSPNFDYSERTLLIFLLAINEKLEEIEKNVDEKKIDPNLIQRVEQVRSWLVNMKKKPLDWDKLKEKYAKIARETCTEMARYYGSKDSEPYFELTMKTVSCLFRMMI